MHKKMLVFCAIFIVFILLIGSFSCARKKPEKFEEKLGQMIDKISNSLNLTEEQKKETAKIKDEILKKNEEMMNFGRKDMKEAEEALTKQIKSDKFNEKELNKILDSHNAKREEMRRVMIGELAKFHAVLTPEQRVKLTSILKEIGQGPGPRPGFKPGPGSEPDMPGPDK